MLFLVKRIVSSSNPIRYGDTADPYRFPHTLE
jgi:hypothetical protein